MRRFLTGMALCGLALGAGCYGPIEADDAGDVAFVHQATQTLLGRRPRGSDEVDVLLAIAQDPARGRAAVVDLLMTEPDFVEYWLRVLVDALRLQREGDFKVEQACVRVPQLLPADCNGASCLGLAENLAEHVRDHIPGSAAADLDDPTDAYPDDVEADAFNMNDAIRAALLVDDLTVAVRPWLFTVGGSGFDADADLASIRNDFMVTVLGRDKECIGCHSSTYSKTEVYPSYPAVDPNLWDRTSTLGWDLEQTTFGTHHVLDASNGTERCTLTDSYCPSATDNDGECSVGEVFLDTCGLSGCHGSDGGNSVGGADSPIRLPARVPLLSDDALEGIIQNGKGAMGAQNIPCVDDMVAFLREELGGYNDLDQYFRDPQFADEDPALPAGQGPWGLDCGFGWTNAGSCTPTDRTFAFGGTELDCPDVGNIAQVLKTGFASLPAEPDPSRELTPAHPDIPSTAIPEVSVAMLVAANLADDLLEEISGGRLTVAHGLSRSPVQSEALQQVIRSLVRTRDGETVLSLKGALRDALLSDAFNRLAPDSTTLATPFELPSHLYPWSDVDPNVTPVPDYASGDNRNSQGDLVHRRSPNQLLWSLSRDLGWPAPSAYPGTSVTFPSLVWMEQLGRFVSADKPGTLNWDLYSLALFESTTGLCGLDPVSAYADPPVLTPVVPGADSDYVARLVEAAFAGELDTCVPNPFGPNPLCLPVRMRGLAIRMKDRLLQDPVLDATLVHGRSEEAALEALFDAELGTTSSLTALVGAQDPVLVERGLRQYCSALLLSPDYLLAGLPTLEVDPVPPATQVCLEGELCGQALTDHYEAVLGAIGY